jgi:hypothetical protein
MILLGTDFDTVLTRAAVAALLCAGAWAVLVLASLVAEARTRGRVRLAERLGCPRAVRAWTLGILLALFAGIAPAHASDTGSGSTIDSALDGLPLPERAEGAAPHVNAAHRAQVVVRPGDSLWRLARDHLPSGASNAEVVALVASLYAVNRPTIGPDPDRLTAGQHLDLPHPTRHPEAP